MVAKAKTDMGRVRRAFRNATTDDRARRIALAALLRSQHEFLAPFDTLPQQLVQQKVVDCLDILSSLSGASLGRSAFIPRLGTDTQRHLEVILGDSRSLEE